MPLRLLRNEDIPLQFVHCEPYHYNLFSTQYATGRARVTRRLRYRTHAAARMHPFNLEHLVFDLVHLVIIINNSHPISSIYFLNNYPPMPFL
jgi:hypothetical protein